MDSEERSQEEERRRPKVVDKRVSSGGHQPTRPTPPPEPPEPVEATPDRGEGDELERDDVPATEVQRQLSMRGVNVSVSIADYARLDLPTRGLTDIVRASVHYYNTESELDRLAERLDRLRQAI